MEAIGQFESFVARLRAFVEVALKERCSGAAAIGTAAGLRAPDSHSERGFEDLALELFALQFDHNAPYRRFCEARKISPPGVEHWNQIPAVPTSAFKELELSCLPPSERTAVFYSSGTTGQPPSRHFHNPVSLALYEASLWPWFREHLLPDCDASPLDTIDLLCLSPGRSHAPHSSLVHMFEVIRQRLAITERGHSCPQQPPNEAVFTGTVLEDEAWGLDLEKTIGIMRGAEATGRKLMILGTAFSFVHLLDELVARGLRIALPAGSRVMETGGYKGRSRRIPKPELHSLLSDRLAISAGRIVCEYGMSELSSQAYDHHVSDHSTNRHKPAHGGRSGLARRFVFPPWTRVQLISPETGRESAEDGTGLIRVFDLANAYSVMAIQTEDLALWRSDGFELLGRAPLAEPRGCSLRAR